MKLRRSPLLLIAAISIPSVLAATTAPTTTPEAPRAHSAAVEQGPPGLRRCVAADGSVLITDHGCSAQGARDLAPPPTDATPSPGIQIVRVRTCARNQLDLVEGVRGALEARDPNRLAEYYHWSGMSTAQGYQLLDRLAAFSARPLLDVQLANSAELRSPGPDWPERQPPRFEPLDPDSNPDLEPRDSDTPAAPAPPAKPADLLRVDQLRSETDMDSQVSYLHLLRNAGCWWLQF
jgi:hypothetical protein